MAGKLIAQIVTAGVQIVGRAFSKALREEIAKSRAAASQRRTASGADSSQTAAGECGCVSVWGCVGLWFPSDSAVFVSQRRTASGASQIQAKR